MHSISVCVRTAAGVDDPGSGAGGTEHSRPPIDTVVYVPASARDPNESPRTSSRYPPAVG